MSQQRPDRDAPDPTPKRERHHRRHADRRNWAHVEGRPWKRSDVEFFAERRLSADRGGAQTADRASRETRCGPLIHEPRSVESVLVVPLLEFYSIRPGPDGLSRITRRPEGRGIAESWLEDSAVEVAEEAVLLRWTRSRCVLRDIGECSAETQATAWVSERVTCPRRVRLGVRTGSDGQAT
jgi:hypothetical protein